MIALTPTLARQLAAEGPPWDSTVYYVTSDPVTSEVLDRSHTPAKSRCYDLDHIVAQLSKGRHVTVTAGGIVHKLTSLAPADRGWCPGWPGERLKAPCADLTGPNTVSSG